MQCHYFKHTLYAIILTLASAATFLSCSTIGKQIDAYYPEECKTHAYMQNELPFYISRRFHNKSPVRMAIIPFASPVNVAGSSDEMPGLGMDLVRQLHGEFLRSGEVPIVEIFNRKDWPGKKEDFYSGNYGALRMARDADYDLVMVGNINPMNGLDNLSVETRIMEAESGISIWYGQSTIDSPRDLHNELKSDIWLEKRRPDRLPIKTMTNKLARCIADGVINAETVPEEQYNGSILPSSPWAWW